MTVGERIRYLRKFILKIKSGDDFGIMIGLSGSNVRNIETNRINVTDRVISDICEKFSVNEDWLRNGGSNDDIFIDYPEEVEIAKYVESLLTDTDDSIIDLIKNFLVIYKKLDNTSQEVLRGVANELLSKKDQT